MKYRKYKKGFCIPQSDWIVPFEKKSNSFLNIYLYFLGIEDGKKKRERKTQNFNIKLFLSSKSDSPKNNLLEEIKCRRWRKLNGVK